MHAATVLWADGYGIHQTNETGTPVTTLLSPPAVYSITSLSADQSAGKLYWTEYYNYLGSGQSNLGNVRRSNLDGTGIETLTQTSYPYASALDLLHGHIYYSSAGAGSILRANLDGSDVTPIYSLLGVSGLAIDPVGGKVYYVTGNAVGQVDFDGTNGQFLFGGMNIQGGDIALDVANQKAYFSGDDGVFGFNLDGTGLETLIGGTVDRTGIGLDLTAGRVYWNESTSASSGSVFSANLDGTDVQFVHSTYGAAPLEIISNNGGSGGGGGSPVPDSACTVGLLVLALYGFAAVRPQLRA